LDRADDAVCRHRIEIHPGRLTNKNAQPHGAEWLCLFASWAALRPHGPQLQGELRVSTLQDAPMNGDMEFNRVIDGLRAAKLAADRLSLPLFRYLIEMALVEALQLEEKALQRH